MSAEAAPLTAARKRKGRWAIVAVVVLAVIIAVVAGIFLLRGSSTAPATLSTATATKRTVSTTVSGTGSSAAADAVTVNPQISGTVKRLDVSLGDTVTAGDTLYTITSDTVKNSYLQAKASLLQSKQSVSSASSQVEQAETQLYTAKTQVIQAKQKVYRLESEPATATDHAYNLKIAKRDLHAANEAVDTAETGVNTAELGLAAAQASLKTSKSSYATAEENLGETVVTAPSDGVITAMPLSVGSAVTAGTSSSSSSSGGSSSSGSSSSGGGASANSGTTSSSSSSGSSITITNMDSLQVELTVSEVDIPKVAVGQEATVTFDAITGKEFQGKVKSILPNATTSSGVVNYTVYVKLDSLSPELRAGMTANVDISTQSVVDVVTVPSSAVKTNNGAKYVLVVGPNNQTTRKTVTVGLADDTYTQVTGIEAGTVVSTGAAATAASSSGRSAGGGGLLGGGMGGPPSGGGGPGGN